MNDKVAYKMLSQKINTNNSFDQEKINGLKMILPKYLFFNVIDENTIVDIIGGEIYIKQGAFYYSENGLALNMIDLVPLTMEEMKRQETEVISEYFIYTVHSLGVTEFYTKMRTKNTVLQRKPNKNRR